MDFKIEEADHYFLWRKGFLCAQARASKLRPGSAPRRGRVAPSYLRLTRLTGLVGLYEGARVLAGGHARVGCGVAAAEQRSTRGARYPGERGQGRGRRGGGASQRAGFRKYSFLTFGKLPCAKNIRGTNENGIENKENKTKTPNC